MANTRRTARFSLIVLEAYLILLTCAFAQGQNLFNYSASVPTLNGTLQLSSGALDTSLSNGSGYGVSTTFAVTPGAGYTFDGHAGGSALFGNGGYPSVEYFSDQAATHLVATDTTNYGAGPVTVTVPANSSIGWARIQFQLNGAAPSNASAATFTSNASTPATPAIVFSIPSHLTTDAPFAVVASSNSSGAFTYSVESGPATIAGGLVTVTGAGTVIIQAAEAAASGFAAASATASFVVTAPTVTPAPSTGVVTVTAAHLGGLTPVTGTIIWQPTACDAAATPTSARLPGGLGITTKQPMSAPVVSGAFSLIVPDTSLTAPANLCYNITVLRAGSRLLALGPGFDKVQPAANNEWCSNGVCNFDNYSPNVPGLALSAAGTQGPAGVTGANGIASLPQLAALRSSGPARSLVNLFDKTAITTGSYPDAGTGSLVAASGFATSDFIPANSGGSMGLAIGQSIPLGAAGITFYDGNKTFLSATTAPTGAVGGYTLAVPSGVAYLRVPFYYNSAGDQANANAAMIVNGTALPSSYQAFGTYPTNVIDAKIAVSGASGLPLTGKNCMVLGDSLSAAFAQEWQNVFIAKTGCNLITQDARPGRTWGSALEGYGASCPLASLSSLTGYNGAVSLSSAYPTQCGLSVSGTLSGSNTIGTPAAAQSLATTLAPVDLLVIPLGTNDAAAYSGAGGSFGAVGTLSDGYTAGTQMGAMNFVLDALAAAKPTLRILLVTNTQLGTGYATNAAQASANAIVAMGNSRGLPVLNMFTSSGVNTRTVGTLLRDGTHPTDSMFQNVYAPAIARFAAQWF